MAAAKKKRAKKKAKKKEITVQEPPEVTKKARGHNLKGRQVGAKNKTTLVKEAIKGDWEGLMQTKAKKVFEAVVEKALKGDTSCMKMILDRAVPVSKAVDINASDIGKTGGITIHIEKLVAETGDVGETYDIEDGEIIDERK